MLLVSFVPLLFLWYEGLEILILIQESTIVSKRRLSINDGILGMALETALRIKRTIHLYLTK